MKADFWDYGMPALLKMLTDTTFKGDWRVGKVCAKMLPSGYSEWHCQASRPRTKVAPALYNSQSSLGEPPLLFLETWQVLPSLSSFAMHNRPRPCWIYFRKSFLPCEREPPPPPLPPGHSTLENEEQLENAGKERER